MRSSLVVAGVVACAAVAVPAHAQNTRARTTSRTIVRPAVGMYMYSADSARAALGLSTSSGTSKRDTLGVLVTSIVSGSPAEKAGLEEGDRIATINGVSLQLAPADTGDREMGGLMGRRLQREMQKVKPGETVHLRVYADGKYKTLDVKAASEADVYADAAPFYFREGDRFRAIAPSPPMPAMPAMPAMPPSVRDDRMGLMRERQSEATARSLLRAQQGMRDAERRMREMRFDFNGSGNAFGGSRNRININTNDDSINATASGSSYVLRVGGLQLAPVSSDLASYFGSGSADGLLVLNADSSTGLHAGDVILKINGQSVRSDDEAHLSFSTRQDNSVDILRKGKRETVTMKPGARDERR
ncbi:MAG TPA: PDZ domain-containing protein [Gemmatimonadaceae bacterium]|nr:PDZ domain-containing protein [Gemmatimonadaceae bacterium]